MRTTGVAANECLRHIGLSLPDATASQLSGHALQSATLFTQQLLLQLETGSKGKLATMSLAFSYAELSRK